MPRRSNKLEIGPGQHRLKGFRHMDVRARRHVEDVADAAGPLPYDDESFKLVYASHVLEHLPWYSVRGTLREWVRILQHGGTLEIWVPDAYKIAQCIIAAEQGELTDLPSGEVWTYRNQQRNPFRWISGRLYGTNRDGKRGEESWHHALFTARYLYDLLEDAGLVELRRLEKPRGYDHGWTNLGMQGMKR